MNCELMLTYDTPHICSMCIKTNQVGKQEVGISNRYPFLWEAFFDPSDSYFLFADLVGFYTHLTFNVYKNQLSRQTGSRNLMGPQTLLTIWHTYMKLVTKYQISATWGTFLDPSDSYCLFANC
jgi:hypothetical protein